MHNDKKPGQLDAYKTNGLSPPRNGGIKMILDGRLSKPMLLCDACGQPLTGESGMAVWTDAWFEGLELASQPPESKVRSEVVSVDEPYFVHKGECDQSLGLSLGFPFGLPLAADISTVLVRILNNARVDYGETMRLIQEWPGLV